MKTSSVESDDEGLWATIQHKGGVTNKVDFSKNIWIALYFAAQGAADRAGKLWRWDISKAQKKGVRITDAEGAFDPTARRRAANQRGVLAESKSEHIPPSVLREAVRVPGSAKDTLLSFLGEIGVNEVALFADIDAFISRKQENIPLQALAILWLDRVRTGECMRVLAETEHLLSANSNDPQREIAASY